YTPGQCARAVLVRDITLSSITHDIPQVEHRPIAAQQPRSSAQRDRADAAGPNPTHDRPLAQHARETALPAILDGMDSLIQPRDLVVGQRGENLIGPGNRVKGRG